MQEIFGFYSRQHIPQGRKFEEMQESMNEIDLGEFMKFCKDFQIPLHKTKQQEIFKKSCYQGHRPLKIQQFEQAIARLGVEMNRMRLIEINQKLKLIQE